MEMESGRGNSGKLEEKCGKRKRIEPSRREPGEAEKILLTKAVSLAQWIPDLFAPFPYTDINLGNLKTYKGKKKSK